MRFKFIRNEDNFVMLAATGDYKINILELHVEFRKIGVDAAIMKRELAAFESGQPYIMPFLNSKFFTKTISAGVSSYMTDIVRGKLPQQLLVFFVRHDAYNSDPTRNPYVFENLDVTNLAFKLNAETVPLRPYRPNFKATPADCYREYQHLMNTIGIKRLNSGVGITLKDFVKHCCIFTLDNTPEQCNNNHVHIGTSGSIALEMTFGTATTTNYQMLAYGIYPSIAKIENTLEVKIADAV